MRTLDQATREAARVDQMRAQLDSMDTEGRQPQTLQESGVPGVPGVPTHTIKDLPGTPPDCAGVPGVPQPAIPANAERPIYRVFDKPVAHEGGTVGPGVWYFDTDKEGNPVQTWICSPIHVEAISSDDQGNNFGRLLCFRNTHGKTREWAMPMEMLAGDGSEVRRELLAMGVEIAPGTKARNLMLAYLQTQHPHRRVRCTQQVGWCHGSFALPDMVIGPEALAVVFQSGERGHDEYTIGGTLEGWQTEISSRAIGNPVLMLALSAGFAGPMLELCNAESGGLHFIGDSSTGKTTALEGACSVWGGTNYKRSWRATANGMEGAAALFNDGLLVLDEISECDPREVGAIVYALGNGRGKQRASRSGSARGVTRWRCQVLSSGERTISTTMTEGGHRVKAGQSVRLLDIPVSRTHGAWNDLHGMDSAAAFSDALKRNAAHHHGRAGRAFLENLTTDTRDFCAFLERFKALPVFNPEGSEGQEKRAAARFALIGMAGELATEYGITRWADGAAIEAAAEGFRLWKSTRSRGNDERRQVVEQVSGFIERHGDSRFSCIDKPNEQTRDRAGWWRDSAEGHEYLFTSDGMREALRGFDFKRALDVLQQIGALPPAGAEGKRSRLERINGRRVRVYPVNAEKLEVSHVA